MKNRGPILIVFGASLVMSPLAITLVSAAHSKNAAPTRIETMGRETAACAALAMTTAPDRSACSNPRGDLTARRTVAGGALFVASR